MHNHHPHPKFSIITVTYNAAKVLEDTIQSIVTQTYKNLEYIIVEDDTLLQMVHSINGTALPGVLYGETEIVDSQGHFLYMRRLSAPATLTWKSFKQGMLVCHQAFFARRDLVEPYDLRYRFSADFDWCIRIMKKADVLHNTHLTLIDYLNEGMTTRNHKASLKERFRIMSRHYGWASTVTHHLWFVLRLLYK